jgi:transposase
MRRRQTKVPNTAQASLGFTGENKPKENTSGPSKHRVGATLFIDATPWHLFIGQERLDTYLNKRGAGWVVKLRKELQQVDFGMLEVNYQGGGRPAYDPRMMMSLIVYGVLQGKHSLREIEGLAVTDVGAWFLCGGNQPDHSTIGDFLERHKEHIHREYFIELVRGLVLRKKIQVGVVAGDGTVVEASTSRFELLSREAAEKAAEQVKAAADEKPEDEELKARAIQAEAVAEVARERAKHKKDKGSKDADQTSVVTPVEPEAVPQKCKDGRFRPGYKPSILVHESGLIVGQAVEGSCESAAVAGLFDQHYEVFGANPKVALFDAGYHSQVVLSEALAREINILCPSGNTQDEQWTRRGNKGKFGKTQFVYDRDSDTYRCPAGHTMVPGAEFVNTRTKQRARKYRTKQCMGCPLRSQCTEAANGRVITRMEADEFKEAMEEVMSQRSARRQYRKRKEIVERVFAEFGWRQALRRFRRRGRSGARLDFALHCIAYNLKWAVRRDKEGLMGAILAILSPLWRMRVTLTAEQPIAGPVGSGVDLELRAAA